MEVNFLQYAEKIPWKKCHTNKVKLYRLLLLNTTLCIRVEVEFDLSNDNDFCHDKCFWFPVCNGSQHAYVLKEMLSRIFDFFVIF